MHVVHSTVRMILMILMMMMMLVVVRMMVAMVMMYPPLRAAHGKKINMAGHDKTQPKEQQLISVTSSLMPTP